MKKEELPAQIDDAIRRAKSLEALAIRMCREFERSDALKLPEMSGTEMPFPDCEKIPERDYECPAGGATFDCAKTAYDCAATGTHEFFECGEFTCTNHTAGTDFTCDPNRDFYCDSDFECTDFICDAGHGYYCDGDNDCVGSFACKSTNNTACDGSAGNTYGDDDASTGQGTSGDFQCSWNDVNTDFSCPGTFECLAPSEFECGNEQTGTFSCGGTSSPDNFSCGKGTVTTQFKCGNTARTDAYDCTGDNEYICYVEVYTTTAVELTSFTAIESGGKVLVQWEYLLEFNNAGFNVYRAEGESSDYRLLNTGGLITGSSPFEFVDSDVETGSAYRYKLGAVDIYGNEDFFGPVSLSFGMNRFELTRAYPNPTRGKTTISYRIGAPEKVEVSIYDVSGRLIRRMVEKPDTPGTYSMVWDGLNARGRKVSPGIYFCKMRIGAWEATKKITMLK